MLKIISWNLARRSDVWRALLETDADIGLVQEACAPPPELAERIDVDPELWRTEGSGMTRSWRTSVVRLNPQVDVQWHAVRSICDADLGELAVSRRVRRKRQCLLGCPITATRQSEERFARLEESLRQASQPAPLPYSIPPF